MRFPSFNPKDRQKGFATLFIVMMLALIMAVIALTTAQVGIMEQKITGNDLRAREAQEAAEAGLEYGVAWAQDNNIPSNNVTCSSGSLPAGCPTELTTITGSSTGETYSYSLTFMKSAGYLKVTSTAQGNTDNSIAAISEAFVEQTPAELFDPGMPMPPPWVIAGCITDEPTGNPNIFVLNGANLAVVSGNSSDSLTCLQQGKVKVSAWNDDNSNGAKEKSEEGVETGWNRAKFDGCPGVHCAWKSRFKMGFEEAVERATAADHVYSDPIPCGPATSSPSIYVINNSGPINTDDLDCNGTNKTIGAPNQPILLIIPKDSGCPKFNGGITVYGIIYFESEAICAANGWGDTKVYGSVIWEGSVAKPNANTEFIEVAHNGNLNTVFNMGMDDATRIPGTWKDF